MASQVRFSKFNKVSREAKADETRKKNRARKRMLKKIDDAVRARHDAFDPTPRLRKKV